MAQSPFRDGQTLKVEVLLQVEGTESLIVVGHFDMEVLASLTADEAEAIQPGLTRPETSGALAIRSGQVVEGLVTVATQIARGES